MLIFQGEDSTPSPTILVMLHVVSNVEHNIVYLLKSTDF